MSYTRRNTTDGVTVMNKDLYDNLQDGIEEKPFYYNSVEEMKADKRLKEDMKAITLGYYEPNDGGGATYIIKEKSSLPNEITVLSLKDGKLCAEIQKNEMGYYNVLTLGVERNSGKDVTDKINAILNILYNETIYFPKGIYDVTSIKIPYPMTFLGSDSASYGGEYSITENDYTNERTILRYCGTGNEDMVTIAQTVKVIFDGITFYGNSVEYLHDETILPTVGVGTTQNTEKISLQNVNGFKGQGITVKHCRFYKFSGYAVKVTGLSTVIECSFNWCATAILVEWDCVIDNIIIGYGRTGILCKPDRLSSCGANIISNIRCDGLMGYPIELINSTRNTITDLIVDQIDKAGICLNNSMNNSFINCNLNRTAKYYAGSSKADLPDETLGFASAIYFCGESCQGNYIDAHIYQEQFDDNTSHSGVISPSLFVISEAKYTRSNNINITSSLQLTTYDKVINGIENLVSAFNGKFFSPTDLFYINSFKVITQPDNFSGILEINGCIVKSLHNPEYLTPYYIGQGLLHNGKYYVATDVKKGSWKEISNTV